LLFFLRARDGVGLVVWGGEGVCGERGPQTTTPKAHPGPHARHHHTPTAAPPPTHLLDMLVQVEHLQPLVSEYLKNVEDVYAAHAAKVLRGWKGLKDAHIPFLELKLERIASNAVTPSKGLLAIHKDRRMALPGILTRSTLDVPYDGGDLVLIDGYLIVDYTEEDAVLFWGDEVAHAVLPPIPRGPREKGMEPIRMSFFHFTKKGRKKPPPRASAEELQAWVAVTYFGGVAPDEEGGGGRRVRSRRG